MFQVNKYYKFSYNGAADMLRRISEKSAGMFDDYCNEFPYIPNMFKVLEVDGDGHVVSIAGTDCKIIKSDFMFVITEDDYDLVESVDPSEFVCQVDINDSLPWFMEHHGITSKVITVQQMIDIYVDHRKSEIGE